MRWDRLFADLEAQWDAALAAELAGEVDDRTRREVAQVSLVARLRAAMGTSVQLGLLGAGRLAGRVSRVGPDWLLLVSDRGECLVPLIAVCDVAGLGSAASTEVDVVGSRLGLGYVLRGLARDRATIVMTLVDGRTARGVVQRVGADFIDVTERADSDTSSTSIVTVPIAAVALVIPGG